MNLNEDYSKLDSLGVDKALLSFPDQIKTTYKQTRESNISTPEFESIIISGMGGSSNAGKIIQGILEPIYDKPVYIFNDYSLPEWANSDTLVILNSYSGNTEETLSGYVEARKKSCKILGISTGGKIAEMIRSSEIEGVVVDPEATNPTNYPKTGLGVSLGALIGLLTNINVVSYSEEELLKSLDELINIRDSWDVKETAEWLHKSIPVLFGGRPLLGSLNAGRNAMCEISRNFTEFYDFPEVNHVLVEAVSKPAAALQKKYIIFESDFNNDRVKLRYNITTKLFKEQGLDIKTNKLVGSNVLVQSLELAHYCAWLGFYISILDNTDPGPEPWILKLKSALAQPVH